MVVSSLSMRASGIHKPAYVYVVCTCRCCFGCVRVAGEEACVCELASCPQLLRLRGASSLSTSLNLCFLMTEASTSYVESYWYFLKSPYIINILFRTISNNEYPSSFMKTDIALMIYFKSSSCYKIKSLSERRPCLAEIIINIVCSHFKKKICHYSRLFCYGPKDVYRCENDYLLNSS